MCVCVCVIVCAHARARVCSISLGQTCSRLVGDAACALKCFVARQLISIICLFARACVRAGTIVSVVRKSTKLAGGAFTTLKEMVEVWEAQAKVALYETPNELEVDGVYLIKEAAKKDASIDSDSGAKVSISMKYNRKMLRIKAPTKCLVCYNQCSCHCTTSDHKPSPILVVLIAATTF